MEWAQNATIRSSIGASEIVRHDVKHTNYFEACGILCSLLTLTNIQLTSFKVSSHHDKLRGNALDLKRHLWSTGNSNGRQSRKYLYLGNCDRQHRNSDGMGFQPQRAQLKKLFEGDWCHDRYRKWNCGSQNRKYCYICNCCIRVFDHDDPQKTVYCRLG